MAANLETNSKRYYKVGHGQKELLTVQSSEPWRLRPIEYPHIHRFSGSATGVLLEVRQFLAALSRVAIQFFLKMVSGGNKPSCILALSLAGGTNQPESNSTIANVVQAKGAESDLSTRRGKYSPILSNEEVAALVGPGPRGPKPPWHLQTVLLASFILVLGFTAALIWYIEYSVQPKQPPEPTLEMSRARTAMRDGRYGQALSLLGVAAVKGGPAHLVMVNRLRAEVLLARATHLIASQPDLALSDITSAIDLAPQWPKGLLQAGRLLIRLKHFEQARDVYISALAMDPQLDVGWFNLGYIYLKTGRYEQGIEALQRTIKLDTALAADAYVNLAICQFRLGRQKEAVAALRIALSINPNHQTARAYLAKLLDTEPQP